MKFRSRLLVLTRQADVKKTRPSADIDIMTALLALTAILILWAHRLTIEIDLLEQRYDVDGTT